MFPAVFCGYTFSKVPYVGYGATFIHTLGSSSKQTVSSQLNGWLLANLLARREWLSRLV